MPLAEGFGEAEPPQVKSNNFKYSIASHKDRTHMPSSPSAFATPALLAQVTAIVQESGDIIRRHNAAPRTIRYKGRIDLVTETDLAVETFLQTHLAPCLPEAAFLAEESAQSLELPACCWVIDPVDGTTNFAHGLPLVATSVALWAHGQVQLGVVNLPLLGECYTAVRGGGAWCNGVPIAVSAAQQVEKSLVATGFPYSVQEELPLIIQRLQAILPATQGVRRCGAAALDLAWVACGRFDAFYEHCLKPWDMAAGWLLVEEAGGVVTACDGSPMCLGKGEVLAAAPGVHAGIQALLV